MKIVDLEQHFFWGFFLFVGIFSVRAVLIGGGTLIWTRSSKWVQSHLLVPLENIPLSFKEDFAPAIRCVLLDAAIVAGVIRLGILKLTDDSSFLNDLLTFFGYFIWFEIFFYYLHRWIHLPKMYFIHRLHHRRRATTPMTSLGFSTLERLLLILGAVVLPSPISHWVPFSAEGLGLYFLYNYLMNVYGHLNVEILPQSFIESSYGKWMSTTVSHSKHHQTFRGNYGLFTQVLDRWHNTQI